MNLRDLQAFIAVAETGSISRAATRLHLTQSATTRRVQNFEATVGGLLLDRSAKPLSLTPAGRQVLAHCRDIVEAIAALEASAPKSGEPQGEIRIGVGMGAEIVLDAPLDTLRRRFPRLDIRVTANWTALLIESLRTRELDVAVAFLTKDHTVPSNVALTELGTESIAVVAARTAKLPRARGRSLRLKDLANQRWVLNPPGCAYRLAVQRAHDAAGVVLQLGAEVIGRDMQLSMVARGVGLGLVSRRALKSSRHRRALRIVPIDDFSLQATIAVLHARALGRLQPVVDLLGSQIAAHLRR